MAYLSGPQRCNVVTIKNDLSGGGREGSGDNIEEGGLSRTIGADEPEDLAGPEGKGDIVERPQPAKILGNFIDPNTIHDTCASDNPTKNLQINLDPPCRKAH